MHIDGFPVVACNSFVVGASRDNPVTGVKAHLIAAAKQAAEVAIRLMRPGMENMAVTRAINQVADDYGVKPVEGKEMK